MSDLAVGKEIGGYRIQEVLGQGGMGVVYKAEEIALSRPVALKRLNPQLADDESFLRRFKTEARAIARVNSPYIVQIFTLSETEIGLVIVMEYVEGRTLKQRITAGETNWKESLPLIQQMLTALHHAHEAGVIHRDVKPQNILLSDIVRAHGIRVKMTDFGLAKVNTSGDPSRTITQGVYGTLPYMSPEQVKGHGEVDHRSDIYSLGMTCYEMLAGRLPFDEESSEYTIMRTIVEEDLPELGTFTAGVPRKLRDCVKRATAKDPSDRFQSAAEMQKALGEFEKSSGQEYPVQESATIPSDPPPPEEDLLKRNVPKSGQEETKQSPLGSIRPFPSWSWRVAGAGAVFAVLLVGAWYFVVGSSAPWTGSKEEATAAGWTGSKQEATAGAEERRSDGDASERSTTGKLSTDEQDQSADPSGGNASKGKSGQTAGEQTTGQKAQGQTTPAKAGIKDEEEVNAGTTGPKAAGRETVNIGENQETDRQNLPSPIPALLDIEDPVVLSKQIRERVERGHLTRGDGPEDFFDPGKCYIFVVTSEGRIGAVLGPKSNGIRVELRSGERINDWESRYGDNLQIWTRPPTK